MSLLDVAYRKVFGTVVIRGLQPDWESRPGKEIAYLPLKKETLKVEIIIMSRQTERELMREDFGNTSGICSPRVVGQPTRIFGARVAFDDSLADGKFLVCGKAY